MNRQQPSGTLIQVVAAVIVRDGLVLACRRRDGLSAAGLWEFPGGKIEPNEPPTDALEREILEELDVPIEVGELIHRATTPVADKRIELHSYLATLAGPPPVSSTDHDSLRWLRPAELPAVEWSRPDRPVVQILAESTWI